MNSGSDSGPDSGSENGGPENGGPENGGTENGGPEERNPSPGTMDQEPDRSGRKIKWKDDGMKEEFINQ